MSANNSDGSAKSSVKDLENARSLSGDNNPVAYNGVKTIEASQRVYGKHSKWFLFLRFVLSAYAQFS